MAFQVEVRKNGFGIEGAQVRIEYPGGVADGETDTDGRVSFPYDRNDGTIAITLDGAPRGSWDFAQTQSVTILL